MRTNRTKYCIANWKMNLSLKDTKIFFNKWITKDLNKSNVKIIFCPSFTELYSISSYLNDSVFELGAQDVCAEKDGAFTGEISSIMLREVGCEWVIIGHSERRLNFNETDELIGKKINRVINGNLSPILCIGESIQERENRCTKQVLKHQLTSACGKIKNKSNNNILIAYEPIWAIGTGVIPSNHQINDIHKYIRTIMNSMGFNGNEISIIYGGSISPDNAGMVSLLDEVDGFLVGGASLKVDTFYTIYKEL